MSKQKENQELNVFKSAVEKQGYEQQYGSYAEWNKIADGIIGEHRKVTVDGEVTVLSWCENRGGSILKDIEEWSMGRAAVLSMNRRLTRAEWQQLETAYLELAFVRGDQAEVNRLVGLGRRRESARKRRLLIK